MNELKELVAKLDVHTDLLMKAMHDHEKRLRILERVFAYGLGAAGAAKLLFDLLLK